MLDGDATHLHRVQHRVGIDRAGAADVDPNLQQAGGGLLAGILVGHGPARVLAHEAQPLLHREAVHLDHQAVGLVGQGVTLRPPSLHEVDQRVEVREAAALLSHREAQRPQQGQRLPLPSRAEVAPLDLDQLIGPEVQRPAGGDAGIQVAQRAGRGVARIGIDLAAGSSLLGLEALEVGDGHVGLAAHHQPSRRPHHLRRAAVQRQRCARNCRNTQRQVAYGAQVRGDVLAKNAVAARRSQNEQAVFVVQHHGQTVDLRFDYVGQTLCHAVRQQAQQALAPGPQLGYVESVAQAEDGRGMLDLAEALQHGAAHPLRRRVGRAQLRVFLFELLQLLEQRVVFSVADQRSVEHVVVIAVARQQLLQMARLFV